MDGLIEQAFSSPVIPPALPTSTTAADVRFLASHLLGSKAHGDGLW